MLAFTAETLMRRNRPFLKGWVTLGLNIRLNGYIYSQHLYNFAAGSFHTKKLCSRLYSIELKFYSQKTKHSVFEPPFGGVRGNVRTSSIARWKTCVEFLLTISEHFSLLLMVQTL